MLSRSLQNLRANLEGPLMMPGDPAMAEEIKAWNLAIAHHPAMVVGATCPSDVGAAVRAAREWSLKVAVQATGHGAVTGIEEDTMLITTRRMNGHEIDPSAMRLRVEAGAKWASVLPAAVREGLAPPNGSSTDVGAVGYALGGGLPVLGRSFGFAADHVVGLEVIDADGYYLRRVDHRSAPDLFWALRGGKAGFGVVTAMEIDLFPLTHIYGGGIYFEGREAPRLLHAYREWVRSLPEAMSTSIALLRLPPAPIVPEPLRGKFVVHLRVAYLGVEPDGAALLHPMRNVATPMIDTVRTMPYTEIDDVHQDPVDPVPIYQGGQLLSDLPPSAVDTVLEAVGPDVESPLLMVEIRHLGGALAREPDHPNAVAGRLGAFSLFALGLELGGAGAGLAFHIESLLGAMSDHAAPGNLPNLVGNPGADPARLALSWSPEVRERLATVKQTVDPEDVFQPGCPFGDTARRAA